MARKIVRGMQVTAGALASVFVAGVLQVQQAPPALAGPQTCNNAWCVPGIIPDRVLGAPCDNTEYFVFATAVAGASIKPGRLLFCGSPRRYAPRWFRSPPMAGIRDLNSDCTMESNQVAQAPDGLFLACVSMNNSSRWLRGDAWSQGHSEPPVSTQ